MVVSTAVANFILIALVLLVVVLMPCIASEKPGWVFQQPAHALAADVRGELLPSELFKPVCCLQLSLLHHLM